MITYRQRPLRRPALRAAPPWMLFLHFARREGLSLKLAFEGGLVSGPRGANDGTTKRRCCPSLALIDLCLAAPMEGNKEQSNGKRRETRLKQQTTDSLGDPPAFLSSSCLSCLPPDQPSPRVVFSLSCCAARDMGDPSPGRISGGPRGARQDGHDCVIAHRAGDKTLCSALSVVLLATRDSVQIAHRSSGQRAARALR